AAVAAFARRRRPRVDWVREQSQALTDLVRRPSEVRDRALREHGARAFHDRYRPLVAEPRPGSAGPAGPSPTWSDDIARTAWIRTAAALIPVAEAISASGRSAK